MTFARLDENDHPRARPGTYRIAWNGPRLCPEVGCPLCGATFVALRVDAFGEVEHLSECRSCPWWGYVTLDGWPTIRALYGSATDKPIADVSEIKHLQQPPATRNERRR